MVILDNGDDLTDHDNNPPPCYLKWWQAAMDDQMLQRIASNLSNCNLHLMFVSDTEVTLVSISRSLDDPVTRQD